MYNSGGNFTIKKNKVALLVMTTLLLVLPIFYLNSPLKFNISTFVAGLFSKSSANNNIANYNLQSASSDQKVSIQAVNPDFPLAVLGNTLYYEWDLPFGYNGTGKITWSGSELIPMSMIIQNSENGLDTYMHYSFDSLEWSISMSYLGYGLPLPV
ncbi:MAG: hypothetical protein ACTSO9_05905 [Candidatus Helarchaeota archaeon]